MQGLVVRNYKFESRLGGGSFGDVWKVTKDGKPFALKMTRIDDDDDKNSIELIFSSYFKLNSPFLVKYCDGFKADEKMFYVMELCPQGDLRGLLKKQNKQRGDMLSTHRVMKIGIQLFLALYELHINYILHRDIKTENVFINDNDDIKLGDFGLSRMLVDTEGKASTSLGTPAYMAPELFQDNPSYDSKADIWGLGVTMYQLCTLELPFAGNKYNLPSIIKKGVYKPISPNTYPDTVCEMIHSMLVMDPTKRPSVLALLKQALVHQFASTMDLLKYFPSEALHPQSTGESVSTSSTSTSPPYKFASAPPPLPPRPPASASTSASPYTGAVGAEAAEFIAEISASHPDAAVYGIMDFQREFKDVFERKATPTECNLFLRMQRTLRSTQSTLQAESSAPPSQVPSSSKTSAVPSQLPAQVISSSSSPPSSVLAALSVSASAQSASSSEVVSPFQPSTAIKPVAFSPSQPVITLKPISSFSSQPIITPKPFDSPTSQPVTTSKPPSQPVVAYKPFTEVIYRASSGTLASSFVQSTGPGSESEKIQSIVIDNGSDMLKAGVGGDDAPRAVFPTVVGGPKRVFMTTGVRHPECYVSDLIEHSRVTNWEEMERIWHHTFYNELKVAPEEHPVLLTERVLPPVFREKMTAIMFETFNVPAMYIENSSFLTLMAAGRTTGLVLDSGHTVSEVSAVFEGYCSAYNKLDVSGLDLTENLLKILDDRGYQLQKRQKTNTLRDIKENLGYVALDFDAEMYTAAKSSSIDRTYKLPDGKVITVGYERFVNPEALFKPRIMGLDDSGIHEKLYQTIQKCDQSIHKDLYLNIVLTGGSTLFKGFAERLCKDLSWLAPSTMKVKILAAPERKYATWIGGSVLTSLTPFQQILVSKAEYDESGPAIIHRKSWRNQELMTHSFRNYCSGSCEGNLCTLNSSSYRKAVPSSSSAMKEVLSIVIDNGSGMLKAGIAGDNAPRAVFPTVVGRPERAFMITGVRHPEYYVGNEAMLRKTSLSLHHPLERGVIRNWEEMERIWHHTFYKQLKVAPEEHPVLLTEAYMVPAAVRERIATVMFETFNVPALFTESTGTLCLYASGKKSGVVVDSGDDLTSIVSIYNNIPLSVCSVDFGGKDLSGVMMGFLNQRGYTFRSASGKEIARDVKEKLGYVVLDFDAEMNTAATSSSIDRTYELPDGQVITIGSERFTVPEILFRPSLLSLEGVGIHDNVYQTIMKTKPDFHKDLFMNVVLAGGSTMFEGFAKRLEKELVWLAPNTMRVNVTIPPERKHSAWIGGSILASVTSFQQMLVTKAEYAESGPGIIHKKAKVIPF